MFPDFLKGGTVVSTHKMRQSIHEWTSKNF